MREDLFQDSLQEKQEQQRLALKPRTTRAEGKEYYLELVACIRYHNQCYFEEANPQISDEEFDALFAELLALEQEHPSWVDPSSPSKKLGEKAQSATRGRHIQPMISLDKVFDFEKLDAFFTKMEPYLEGEGLFAELKIDGCAVSIHYHHGRLSRALTRGDGLEGDLITDKLALMLPRHIPSFAEAELIELRGEIYLPFEKFEEDNARRKAQGARLFANPRNAAAGALKLLDLEEFRSRGLEIALYQIAYDSRQEIDSLKKSWQELSTLELPRAPWRRQCRSRQDLLDAVQEVEELRAKLPFGIDGLVFKVGSYAAQEDLGYTGQYYRWAIAYKFSPQRALTKLLGIHYQVGRTGTLTPVALLRPVLVDGSTVQRASLYNIDEIARLELCEEDWVEVYKGGDIIPKLTKALAHKRGLSAPPFEIPVRCPSCEAPLVRAEGEVAIKCQNGGCKEQSLRRLVYFCSKDALDIEGLGERSIEQLFSAGLLGSIRDLLALKPEQFAHLEGFGELSASQVSAQIEEKSKDVPFARLLFALGLPGIGSGLAKTLARELPSFDDLFTTSMERLIAIDGMGPVTARELFSLLQCACDKTLAQKIAEGDFSTQEAIAYQLQQVEELIQSGALSVLYPQRYEGERPLEGQSVVITGSFPHFSRKELSDRAEFLGARVSATLSKKTHWLLCGEKPGSKLEKARKLGVTILEGQEALAKLELP